MRESIGDEKDNGSGNGSGSGSSFIPHLHAFRGFAILNIVAIHAFAFMIFGSGEPDPDSGMAVFHAINESLFHDSTLYFALISGLLYSRVLADRGWKRFFASRLTYVLLPYAIITVVLSALWWSQWNAGNGDAPPLLRLTLYNLITGRGLFHLWYLPVLLVLFALTPLIEGIRRHKRFKGLLWVLVVAPLVASRTWPDMGVTTLIYFLGCYTLGILMGANYSQWLRCLKTWWLTLWGIAVVTSAFLVVSYLAPFEWYGPVSIRESLFYIQKLAMAALCLVYLKRFEARIPAWLDVLANNAFAIYFLHGIVVQVGQGMILRQHTGALSVPQALGWGLSLLLASLVLSLGAIMLLKRVLGRHSRMIVGS